MDTFERRSKLEKILKASQKPITGSELAKKLEVSRQIIVQDIALLRAKGFEIMATPNGYISNYSEAKYIEQILCKQHKSLDEIYEELLIIVNMGGKIIDIIVGHPVYGDIKVDLNIKSKRDIDNFIKKVKETNGAQLSSLTKGNHIHTIEVETKQILEEILNELKEKDILV